MLAGVTRMGGMGAIPMVQLLRSLAGPHGWDLLPSESGAISFLSSLLRMKQV